MRGCEVVSERALSLSNLDTLSVTQGMLKNTLSQRAAKDANNARTTLADLPSAG